MIKFRCSKCGQSYKGPDDYIGKTLKCKKCGHPELITKDNAFCLENDANDLVHGEHDTAGIFSFIDNDNLSGAPINKMPASESLLPAIKSSPAAPNNRSTSLTDKKRLLIGGGIVLLILLAGFFLFRDTWEVDNFEIIIDLEREASDHAFEHSFEQAIIAYDELFSFVESKAITIDTLLDVIDRARISYEEITKVYEDKLYQSCSSLMQEADGLEKQGEYQRCIGVLKDANEIASTDVIDSERLKNIVRRSSTIIDRLKSEITRINKEREAETRRWEEQQRAEAEARRNWIEEESKRKAKEAANRTNSIKDAAGKWMTAWISGRPSEWEPLTSPDLASYMRKSLGRVSGSPSTPDGFRISYWEFRRIDVLEANRRVRVQYSLKWSDSYSNPKESLLWVYLNDMDGRWVVVGTL